MKQILMEVSGLTVYHPYQGYMVILKEHEGNRWLPILVGPVEAHLITNLLKGERYQRPLTYDMFHALLRASDARVEQVVVSELRDSTFYAEVTLRVNDVMTKDIDARPSDAIALALKTRAPIYVSAQVLAEAGLVGEIATGQQPDITVKLKHLTRQLEEAVEQEAYEEAARIRDQIKSLEEQVKSS
ncbi:MAG: hypothetical protein FJY65_06920 [Calditrichaeota bacterium]|nr:hypothetical protein [Calditrichota bacterium]